MTRVYLQITLKVEIGKRRDAGLVYSKYKQPFLRNVKGALSKELLIRDEDVQVLHAFDKVENAKEYLRSEIFAKDIVGELSLLWAEAPDIKIYSVA
jgi:hypothetical protein